MSSKALADAERASLDLILEDLRYLFGKDEILQEEIDDVLRGLKSEEVRSYIKNLSYGSKPETALRESFIAGKSILLRYLFGEASPEVRSDGFIDYLVKDEMGRGIALELKPLFEADVEFDKAGKPLLKRLKQKKIKPEDYRDQILKYIREGEAQFVILTNLKEWFFYSKELSPKEVKYFSAIGFFDFIREYDVIGNLRDYLERKEFESIRYELDKWFLQSLKTWVNKLSEIKFTVDVRRKLELIIGMVNKFIFVQTLDDYGVIEFNWIRKRWNHHEQMWQRKGKLIVLEKFFDELDEWFYLYYDTELFKEKILQYVEKGDENIDKIHRDLQLVLGLTYLQVPLGAFKGIMQYNFRYIDEDIFGKAYETFLGEVRHEEGVYYTPKYITQFIAENTVGKILDETLAGIKKELDKEDFKYTIDLVDKFTSIRVLDPACGSGSFLIKAIRIIVDKYRELNRLIENTEKNFVKRYSNYLSSLELSQEIRAKLELMSEIKGIVGPKSDRELISRILVRHIHGNDLDRRALEVAKVNIWLEAIKLSPKEFRYDKLPAYTNYILPNLEMNLCNGDSVVGLPEELTIKYLNEKHRTDVVELFDLRRKYLENPVDPKLVDEIEKIKYGIRKELNEEFAKYLKARELPMDVLNATKPFHWALDFWYFYFDKKGDLLPEEQRGTHVVIGNPPYERIQVLRKKSPIYVDYLNKVGYESAFKNYDLAVIFVERGFKLLRKEGEFGYIVTNKFMQADYGEAIMSFLSSRKAVREIINFGDQQVFEPEATTYTALVFLKNSKNEKFKYALVKELKRNFEQLLNVKNNESLDENDLTVFVADSGTLSKTPWVFALANEERIVEKLKKEKKLRDVRRRVFQGLVTGADPVFILQLVDKEDGLLRVFSNSMNREYTLEKELLKPLLKGKDITKWTVEKTNEVILFPYIIEDGKARLIDAQIFESRYPRTWKYLLDNRQLLENRERGKWRGVSNWYAYGRRQNLEQFDQPKIMTQVLADKSSFAIDKVGFYYFVGGGNAGGYGIVLRSDQNLSLYFVCGLLNSSALDWNLKKISTRFRGGFYSYARRFLERLPIKAPQTRKEYELSSEIEHLVDRIILLKRARYKLIDFWDDWSVRLKNDEQSLQEVLTQDVKDIRDGRLDKTWTSKATFYPIERIEILDRPFNDFKVLGEVGISVIRIYGLDENNREKLVYEIEFGNRELMLHIYHSLLQTLGSRAKIKTLSQVFAKTVVPIIKEVNRGPNELTPNVMKKATDEFGKWLKEEKIEDVEADIVKINNEMEDIEAEMDALVFKLYGLREDEIKVVFDSLKTPTIHQGKVLEFFRKL